MSLDPSLAESLFGDDLYQITPKMLVILPKAWDEITAEEKNQLSKILAAVKLNLDSVQIIIRASTTVESVLPFGPEKILSFGSPFQPEIPPYENIKLNAVNVIYADALNILDDLKKRNLWLALKNMFGV